MDHERFRDWFSHVDDLTATQRAEVAAALSAGPQGAASPGGDRTGVDDERRCPHCGSGGAVARCKARGLRRYRCKACGKTFGTLTGSALSGLHHKECWLSLGESLAEGETIRGSAARCGIAPSRAHRWRHRFLEAVRQAPDRACRDRRGRRDLRAREPEGGAEAGPQAAPTRRQGPQTRPLARAGADPGRRRSHGATLSHTLPALNADSVREALEPVIARDALLVSDANRCYLPVTAALDIPHESINRSADERARSALHIQTVNSRHSEIKGFLRGFRGIATKYLDSYLRWFHLIELGDQPSPRACLEAAMAWPCLRSAN